MRQLKLIIGLILSFFITANYANSLILKDLHGNQTSFQSLKGKWVFINYWASWCQPCLDEIKELNHFYRLKKENITLFAVNFDQLPIEEQLALAKKYQIHYPSLRQNPAKALHLANVQAVPVTFVIAPDGELAKTLYGPQTVASLSKAMERF